MIRVVVADDHHLVRESIASLLRRAPDIDVVGQADGGREAVELACSLEPDILLMDLAMPNRNGIQACEELRHVRLRTRVMMLSMYGDSELVHEALRAGARGFLSKSVITSELLRAIRIVHAGGLFVQPDLGVDGEPHRPEDNEIRIPNVELTPREHDILDQIVAGRTNRQIAKYLGISIKTVEKHRESLMHKLCVHDVVSLVRAAIQRGLAFWQ